MSLGTPTPQVLGSLSQLWLKVALEGGKTKRSRKRRERVGRLFPEFLEKRACWGVGVGGVGVGCPLEEPPVQQSRGGRQGHVALEVEECPQEDMQAQKTVRAGEGGGAEAGEAEAAYQAVSCGDKQGPEVI